MVIVVDSVVRDSLHLFIFCFLCVSVSLSDSQIIFIQHHILPYIRYSVVLYVPMNVLVVTVRLASVNASSIKLEYAIQCYIFLSRDFVNM